ncbi:hypothetical protein pEaSNUABM39_00263 [Erwinia phage pEa_SNUABM_39]|nr:hypothetical protein pEaSNUABM39_00263 [Erwinia phage pEa_SNUABM_39]
MTTLSIADLKTPAAFTTNLTFGHMEELRANLERALNRPDLEVYVDCDSNYTIEEANTDGPDQLVGDHECINVHVRYVGMSFDESTAKGVWDILMQTPHEDNSMSEWSNSYIMFVADEDLDALEEVTVENGNPRMYETFVDRINYWLPKL